jgi:UDPglucose--hexose-1-phosphate uridylyltransferase
MGLAVLPARLKSEIEDMKSAILSGSDFADRESTAKHKAWFEKFKDEYEFTESNTEEILKAEIGKTFVRVLRDAGVFKDTNEGREAFLRFVKTI